MTYQSNSNAYVAFKKQVAKGTQATGAGGLMMPLTGGSGLQFSKAAVNSKVIRRDGMMKKGRHGTQKLAASYDTEAYIGAHIEPIMEAILRDTWEADALTLTEADFTSLAIAANVLTAGANDPRTKGLRVGDVFSLANMATAGNNGKNLRLSAIGPTTFTTPDTLVDELADNAFTLTRPKKLIQFSAGTIVRRYWTVEERDEDLGQSEVATDFVWGGFKFSMSPDGIVTVTFSGTGTGEFDPMDAAAALLTNPVEPTGEELAVVDATLRVGGQDVVDLTGFNLTGDIGTNAPSTFGNRATKVSPDVFTGNLGLSLDITALRQDLQAIQDFKDEQPYDLHVVMARPGATPEDFISLYVGNFTLGGVAKSALSNQAGPRTAQMTVPTALTGIDDRGTGYDPTMIKLQSTGA